MKSERAPARRPRLPKVDPEMRRWSALLEEEVATWPGVTTRPMFGLGGYYRDGRIFAAIPRTRAVETPFSLLIKLPGARGARLTTGRGPGAGWITFALESDADIAEALRYLGRAYERAGTKKAPRRRVRR
jgi:Luciferase